MLSNVRTEPMMRFKGVSNVILKNTGDYEAEINRPPFVTYAGVHTIVEIHDGRIVTGYDSHGRAVTGIDDSHGRIVTDTKAAPATSLHVEVSSVARTTSLIVLVICLFSLVTFSLTGFVVIHPLISVLVGAACLIFYGMGAMIGRAERPK